MRKKDWKTLCLEHREFAVRIKRSFLIKMNNVVLPKIKRQKDKDIKKLNERADHKSLFYQVEMKQDELDNLIAEEFLAELGEMKGNYSQRD